MFIPVWLLALAAFAFVLLAFLALRPRGGGEMLEDQQRDSRRIAAPAPHPRPAHVRTPHTAALPPSLPADEAALLAIPEIRDALAGGHKIEAIKQVRERTGLGLKEAKDLVERIS